MRQRDLRRLSRPIRISAVYASLSAFRAESLAWMQVAELELRQLHMGCAPAYG